MPKVGGKKFEYDKAGKKAAKEYAKKKGMKVNYGKKKKKVAKKPMRKSKR
jgi:hypothetical protein